jgi:glycosyltransferase involved in cell wall biosynthesis
VAEGKILTLAVPAYNAEKTLRACLDSLLEPPILPLLDIIVIDDGSRDKTGAIADEYAQRQPESIRVIHKENGGHGSGINAAIKLAQGKYFKVVDADDSLLRENLAAFIKALKDTAVDVVLTHFYARNSGNGKKRYYRTEGIRLNREYTFEEFWSKGKGVRASCRFHGICYRTDFYRGTGVVLSEKVYYEDQEYATLPFRRVTTILPLDLVLYEYTLGGAEQSVSNNNRLKHIDQIEKVLWVLWEQYHVSPEMPKAASGYFVYKMAHVLFSYYVTALLVNPDRKEGRMRARRLRDKVKSEAGVLYQATRMKYRGTLLLHYLGISWGSIVAVQHTGAYRLLFKAAS